MESIPSYCLSRETTCIPILDAASKLDRSVLYHSTHPLSSCTGVELDMLGFYPGDPDLDNPCSSLHVIDCYSDDGYCPELVCMALNAACISLLS